jgi:nucleotide-binding universal stress UspA family protein
MWKILLPVDGSESSVSAVRHVVQLAKGKDDVSVTLLYVHYEPVPLGAVAASVTAEQVKEIERQYAEPILGKAEGLLREAGVNFEREVRVASDIAPTIAQRAEALGSDTVVMGTHGGGPLAQALMGSTAMKVVHLVKVPVTLVK